MNPTTPSKKAKNFHIIWLLFAITLLGPFAFAWVLVQKGNAYQMRTNNHGELITPALNIATLSLHDDQKEKLESKLAGKWWLMYVGPQKCHQDCQEILYNMRQIRTALGKESHRLERLFIASSDCEMNVCEKFLNEQYPQVLKAKMKPQDFERVLGSISNTVDREMIGEIYIVDPKGNIMMYYSGEAKPREILADLKKLLKVSKIG